MPGEPRGQIINPAKTANKVKNQVIDGFVKSPVSSAAGKHRTSPAGGLHKRAQKASTLMRGAIKKPAPNFSGRVQHLSPGINPMRELRAKKVSKHSRVEHFGHPRPPEPMPSDRPRPLQGEVINHSPAGPSHSRPKNQSVALPSMVASASHQRLERMLDAALTQADAHKQALKYNAARHFWQRPGFLGRRTRLKITALIIIILLAGLAAAWQKMPQLSVKIAGARAHVSAAVPSYRPDGYKLAAPASVRSGAVVIKYKSAASGSFDIAQRSSNMTSISLAQSVVPQGAQVQTSHVDGNTVYIFGSNNDAAWVNNGVLFTIKDRSQLSSDQIIKIVHGLN